MSIKARKPAIQDTLTKGSNFVRLYQVVVRSGYVRDVVGIQNLGDP